MEICVYSDRLHPEFAAERLGDSTVVLTLNIYSPVLLSLQQDAVNEIEQILFVKKGWLKKCRTIGKRPLVQVSFSLMLMVAWDGFEPPTRGFSDFEDSFYEFG